MKNILLTGSNGFIGGHFLKKALDLYTVRCISLHKEDIRRINFAGIDTVVHMGGINNAQSVTDQGAFYKYNFELTKHFAQVAKAAGVNHFVFISTTKVYGTKNTAILNEGSICNPEGDPYAHSKYLAEKALEQIAVEDFIISIIRPPLVYGPGVKGNFRKLIRLIRIAPTLPLGAINNKRSMVFVENLVAMILVIIDKKMAGIFLASDRRSYSTSQVILRISHALNRKIFLFKLPNILAKFYSIRRPAQYHRLFSSNIIDGTSSNNRLDFNPPFTMDYGINKTVQHFLNEHK